MCWLHRNGRADMEFAQLPLVNSAWRVGQWVVCSLCLRERDHFADRLPAREQHHHAVDADGESAVRGGAERQRLEQEAELLLLLFRRDAEQIEHGLLHIRAMDT